MSKGKHVKKSSKKFPRWMILLLLTAVLAILACIFWTDRDQVSPNGETIPTNQREENTVPSQSEEHAGLESESGNTENTDPAPTTAPDETQDSEEETQPAVVIVQKADAQYEKWLAAAMVVCVSMEYPDFELEGVYTTSSTTLEDKFSSEGAYIVFSSGGNRIAIHANALEQERTASGTKDISTEVIGFATFDLVTPDDIDFTAMDEIAVADLSELIAQSLLVSIYMH